MLTRIVLPGAFASAWAIAAHPDGKKIYVTSGNLSNKIWVIDTQTNTVIRSITAGSDPLGVAVSRAGKLYVTNNASNDVSVIDAATEKVIATIPVETPPYGVSLTPDGSEVYVTNPSANKVTVINTATNTVTARIPVGDTPVSLGAFIRPTVAFQTFYADLKFGRGKSNYLDSFKLDSTFTLNSRTSDGINPRLETVLLRIGALAVTIPPGSFVDRGKGQFAFDGQIGGVRLKAAFKPGGNQYGGRSLDYTFTADARDARFDVTRNPVTLTVGNDSGSTVAATRILAPLGLSE